MEKNPLKWPMSCLAGILVILLYCTFTIISVAFYPIRFTPFTNWLSDLGNMYYTWLDVEMLYFEFNPQGGIFYNLGVILTGVALIPFFYGLKVWATDENRKLLTVAQIVGFFSSPMLMMIGFHSEDVMPWHSTWTRIFFIAILGVLIIVSIALYKHESWFKFNSYFGIIIAIFDVIFVFFGGTALAEWITIFAALGFVALVVFNTFKLEYS